MTNNRKSIIGLSVLTIGLAIVCFLLFQKVNYLNDRLITLGDNVVYYCDSIDNSRFEKYEFREQQYIRQQERDFTVLMTLMFFLATLTGFISYKLSADEFTFFKKQVDKKHRKQKANYRKLQNKIEATKADLNYETYLIRLEDAKRYSKAGSIGAYVFYSLTSLMYLSLAHIFRHNNGNTDLAESLLESIRMELKNIVAILTKEEDMGNISKQSITKLTDQILKVDDEEVRQFIHDIFLKLKFNS